MSGRTRIKICGMTDMQEVDHAVAAGVDALGFIFAKESPRYISPETAREIVCHLPPFVDGVGVFVDEDPELVHEIVQYCGLSVIQLHGAETPEYCSQFGSRVVKAFRVREGMGEADFLPYDEIVSGFLLDTYQKGMPGGTGETFDWSLVNELDLSRPVILAGGLSPDNVGEAIRRVRPFAVDINSAIETEPGRKDPALIDRIVEEVLRANQP